MTKLIVFDFDGTIADTADGIIASVRETLIRMGLPMRSDAQIRDAIGLPLKEFLIKGGNLPENMSEEGTTIYREVFGTVATSMIRLFDGVKDTLFALRAQGIDLAIATSRGRRTLESILESQGISELFRETLTAVDGIKAKPAPDMVLTILERTGYGRDECIVAGDTSFDIEMGKNAGCHTIGVTFGNHSRSQLLAAGADWTVDDFATIADIVHQIG